MNRIDAITAIAQNLRDLIIDTVPASLTGTSIDADRLIHPRDNQLQGNEFYIYSGAAAGQARTVGTFIAANNRMIFAQPFASTPSINSNFLVFEHFMKSEYDAASNRLIGQARLKHLEENVATMQIIATQYEYAVPSGFEYISTLRIVPSGNNDYGGDVDTDTVFEIPQRFWRIEANPLGTFIIAIDARKIDLDYFNEQYVRVMGQSKPDISATDNATIPPALEEFIIEGASMLMASQRIGKREDEWDQKFRVYRQFYNEIEPHVFIHPRGKRVGV